MSLPIQWKCWRSSWRSLLKWKRAFLRNLTEGSSSTGEQRLSGHPDIPENPHLASAFHLGNWQRQRLPRCLSELHGKIWSVNILEHAKYTHVRHAASDRGAERLGESLSKWTILLATEIEAQSSWFPAPLSLCRGSWVGFLKEGAV